MISLEKKIINAFIKAHIGNKTSKLYLTQADCDYCS